MQFMVVGGPQSNSIVPLKSIMHSKITWESFLLILNGGRLTLKIRRNNEVVKHEYIINLKFYMTCQEKPPNLILG